MLCILWNPKVCYCGHMNIPPFPSLSHINLFYNPPQHRTSLSSISTSYHLFLGLLWGFFPSDFPFKVLYTFLISPMHATYPTVFILLDSIVLIIFGEKYKLWSYLLCNFLWLFVTSSFVFPVSSPCCQTPSLFTPQYDEPTFTHTHAHTEQQTKFFFVNFNFYTLDIRWETADSELHGSQYSWHL
jgi:hypothetical protein